MRVVLLLSSCFLLGKAFTPGFSTVALSRASTAQFLSSNGPAQQTSYNKQTPTMNSGYNYNGSSSYKESSQGGDFGGRRNGESREQEYMARNNYDNNRSGSSMRDQQRQFYDSQERRGYENESYRSGRNDRDNFSGPREGVDPRAYDLPPRYGDNSFQGNGGRNNGRSSFNNRNGGYNGNTRFGSGGRSNYYNTNGRIPGRMDNYGGGGPGNSFSPYGHQGGYQRYYDTDVRGGVGGGLYDSPYGWEGQRYGGFGESPHYFGGDYNRGGHMSDDMMMGGRGFMRPNGDMDGYRHSFGYGNTHSHRGVGGAGGVPFRNSGYSGSSYGYGRGGVNRYGGISMGNRNSPMNDFRGVGVQGGNGRRFGGDSTSWRNQEFRSNRGGYNGDLKRDMSNVSQPRGVKGIY